ncbi:asparagine synthetase B family protein [Mesorhizobium japonicum]|uniref:asparagine synthase (glutamine-hydrolyzing) n=1 Tax=Mesorhizobium japonicum (strain LMG 29417 / CECT 9101 / MAFF 303099) TaxID=266835 RepID=Q982D6_RHILO|nr:asparagine synthetase B [Mesorhizobium japonicum]BAB54523.1 mlr9125 [Mesorhizobium japonicum MAFF 303099]
MTGIALSPIGALWGIVGAKTHGTVEMGAALTHRGCYMAMEEGPTFSFGARHSAEIWPISVDDDIAVVYSGFPFVVDEETRTPRYLSAEDIRTEFLRFGADFFRVLCGHYAIAVYCYTRHRLILVRDAFGVQSLSWASSNENFAFSTEYKALLSLPWVERNLDHDAARGFVDDGWAPAGRTFLRHISMVLPGSILIWQNGNLETIHLRQDLCKTRPPFRPISVRHVEMTVRETIGWQANDFSPRYGVMLSSGVDSAVIAATLRRIRRDSEIHTFTVGYGYDDPEIIGASATASVLGTQHHEIIVRPDALTALLTDTIVAVDNPGGYEEFPCLYALHQEARQFVDIIFSGNAADTLFAGMPYHRDLLSTDDAIYRRLCNDLTVRDERLAAQELLAGRHGLNFRMPYAERILIDLALEIPDFQKLSPENDKIIFREAARQILPDEITMRPKRIQHLLYDDSMCSWLAERIEWICSSSLLRTHSLGELEGAAILPPRNLELTEESFKAAWNVVALATWASIYLA